MKASSSSSSRSTRRASSVLWLATLVLALALSFVASPVESIGQVRRAKNGRTFCPGSSTDTVLTVSPKKPLYKSCLYPNDKWHRVLVDNLVQGRHYSIRLSYIALRTYTINLKLETILTNGTSIFTDSNKLESQVILKHRERSVVQRDRLVTQSRFYKFYNSQYEKDFHDGSEKREAARTGSERELLDTYVKFLNPVHSIEESHIEKMYLYIRIVPEGLPSGELYNEFGVYTASERQESQAYHAKNTEFFEFDILIAEQVLKTVQMDIVPILLVCITIFLLMNLYVLRRWHRYLTGAQATAPIMQEEP